MVRYLTQATVMNNLKIVFPAHRVTRRRQACNGILQFPPARTILLRQRRAAGLARWKGHLAPTWSEVKSRLPPEPAAHVYTAVAVVDLSCVEGATAAGSG